MLGITSCGSTSERSRHCGLFLFDLSAVLQEAFKIGVVLGQCCYQLRRIAALVEAVPDEELLQR